MQMGPEVGDRSVANATQAPSPVRNSCTPKRSSVREHAPSVFATVGVGIGASEKAVGQPRFNIAAKRAGQRKKKDIRSQMLLVLDEPTSSLGAMLLHLFQLLLIVLSVLVIVLLSSQTKMTEDQEVLVLHIVDFCCDICSHY